MSVQKTACSYNIPYERIYQQILQEIMIAFDISNLKTGFEIC